jgi:AAA family ATP:ADP antiporter
VESVGREPLLYACLVPLAGIIGIVFWIHHREHADPADAEPCCPDEDLVQEDSGSAFFEGARLVATSRYLLGIAALLAIYEMTSNVVDFQLSAVIEEQIQNSTARDQAFGIIGQATSAVSILVQLFLTSYVMKRHGVKIALYFLPVALLGGTLGFLVAPTLLFVGIMSVSDNGLNYSINQSAREALYTPTSQDAKYKAKAFIDMFIQRAAKVLAVVLNLGLTAVAFLEVRWLSLVVLLLIGGWLFVIHHLGDAFEEQKGEAEAVPA